MSTESKLTKTKLIQISLFVIGGILIIVSGFMYFSTSVVPVESEIQFKSIQLNGFNSALWYVYFLGAILLTFIAHYVNSIGMKQFYYLCLLIGGLFTGYVSLISSFTWGGPVPPSLNNGAVVGFIGFLIFIITQIVFIPRKFYTSIMNIKQYFIIFGIYLLLLSTAFLPYERSDYGIKNGIDHNDFFIFWIYGLLLLLFGFRKTLMSKILTFSIILLSTYNYYNFHYYEYIFKNKSYEIGFYTALIAYITIVVFAIYVIFRKKNNEII
jgi:hypothetical protein